jgi:hypothetical protein
MAPGAGVTVTLWVALATLPDPSVACQVITVLPAGKRFPAGTPDRDTWTLEQSSLVTGRPSSSSETNTLQPASPAGA